MARLGPLRFQPQIPKAAQSDNARDHCCEIADVDTLDAARNLRSRCPASWVKRPSGLGDFQLLKPRVYATAVPGLQTNPLHRVRPSRWEQGAAERKSGTGTAVTRSRPRPRANQGRGRGAGDRGPGCQRPARARPGRRSDSESGPFRVKFRLRHCALSLFSLQVKTPGLLNSRASHWDARAASTTAALWAQPSWP